MSLSLSLSMYMRMRVRGKESVWQCRRRRFDPWVRKIPLEEEMAAHSRIIAWITPWTEDSGGPQCMGLQRVRHDWQACIPVSPYLFCPPPNNLLSTLFPESSILNTNLTVTLFSTCLWLHITLKTEVPKFHKSQWLCIAVISSSALWLKRNTYLFHLQSN